VEGADYAEDAEYVEVAHVEEDDHVEEVDHVEVEVDSEVVQHDAEDNKHGVDDADSTILEVGIQVDHLLLEVDSLVPRLPREEDHGQGEHTHEVEVDKGNAEVEGIGDMHVVEEVEEVLLRLEAMD
jgi:hypothetical protein